MLGREEFFYWGNRHLVPMLLVNNEDIITWYNQWACWLFNMDSLQDICLRQLPGGKILTAYVRQLRTAREPKVKYIDVNGMSLEVDGMSNVDGCSPSSIFIKFHARNLSRAAMLEIHRFMQDFALETGDRVNNPLTTVLNCLHMLERGLANSHPLHHYVEMAIREAYVMKEFGDWVRRLSEEPPVWEEFDLVETMAEVLDRRGGNGHLVAKGRVRPVVGSQEHSILILGGLVNLIKQAAGKAGYVATVANADDGSVYVTIDTRQPAKVKDLRMLTEEFYGGLGLMAARYLLAQMQAHLELEYKTYVGIRVTYNTMLTRNRANPGP